MTRTLFVSTRTALLTVIVIGAGAGIIGAQENRAEKPADLRVSGAQVSVLCPLTIGGSFEAKTRAVSGDLAVGATNPLEIAGDLLVDLQTLETGIGVRDRHMRTKYLEVQRGPEFANARVQHIRLEKPTGKTTFHATLTLHGQTKDVAGTAEIKPYGDGYRLAAAFPVHVSEFGIPEPKYLGVGMKDEVEIRVNFNAAPTGVATTGRKD